MSNASTAMSRARCLAEGKYGFCNGMGAGPTGGAKIFDFGIAGAFGMS